MTILIKNIGEFFTGDLASPIASGQKHPHRERQASPRLTRRGQSNADTVLDAAGGAVMPGLVDGHVHPMLGEWTPAQDAMGWIGNYLHGGTTTMISAGELHIPGIDYDNLTPELVTSLAIVTAATTGRVRWSGVKVQAGTALLVAGMTETAFRPARRMPASNGSSFCSIRSRTDTAEARNYVRMGARARHARESSHRRRVALRRERRLRLQRAVVAAAGHCRPCQRRPDPDERRGHRRRGRPYLLCARGLLVGQLPLDRSSRRAPDREEPARSAYARHRHAGRHRRHPARHAAQRPCTLRRCAISAPGQAVAVATGNTARAHGVDVGLLEVGRPADIVVCGSITGSAGTTLSDAIAHGDLPGISARADRRRVRGDRAQPADATADQARVLLLLRYRPASRRPAPESYRAACATPLASQGSSRRPAG